MQYNIMVILHDYLKKRGEFMDQYLWVIELLVLYSGILTIKYFKLRKLNKINYSNYQNCLRALADTDPKLANYLKGKGQ